MHNPPDPAPPGLSDQKITARTVDTLSEQLQRMAPGDPQRAEHAHYRCRTNASSTQTGKLLAVSDPRPCSPPPGTELEPLTQTVTAGRMLANLYGGEHLSGAAATRANVFVGLATAWVVHLGVHGFVDTRRFRQSRALLADEDGLPSSVSLQDLIDRIYSHTAVPARHVQLGACWLGSADRLLPDENQSFPTALVANGVGGVIAPLWPMHDHPNFDFVKVSTVPGSKMAYRPRLAPPEPCSLSKTTGPETPPGPHTAS